MIVLSSPSSVELEPSSGVLEQKQADAYELKTAGRVAPSPVTGRNVSVSYVMRHPQFDADIVEDHETSVQFVDPPPSAAALARLYDVDYNDAYGRDLSPDAVIPPFVARRAKAQCAFVARHLPAGAALESVVEVGGGWGALSSEAMSRGAPFPAAVSCFELDGEAVDFMASRGVDARKGTLEASPAADFPPGSVDLILSSMMLEHLPDSRAAVAAWRGRLKVGGHLFVEIPLENPVPTWWGSDPARPYWVGHITFFAKGHLEAALESLGFAVVAAVPFDGPVCPGYVNAGDAPYDVAAVPEARDDAPSQEKRPRLLRVLATKL